MRVGGSPSAQDARPGGSALRLLGGPVRRRAVRAQDARPGGSALQPAADPVMIGAGIPMLVIFKARGVGTVLDLVLLLVQESGAACR